MPLRTLHRRVTHWIQRPAGKLAGVLLLVAVVAAGMPTGEVHAHADGDHAHDHAAQVDDGMSDPIDAPDASDPVDPAMLHAHDIGTTVSTLPVLPVVVLSGLIHAPPSARVPASPPPSSARIPPHRPPIA